MEKEYLMMKIKNGKYSFVMKHSGKKYTIRMFTGLDEMAETNAYNIYRTFHTEEETKAHGFHQEFHNEIVREIMDVVEKGRRKRSAVNLPENQLGEGHRLVRCDDWVGEGKNKRRKRSDCAYCPYLDEFGGRNHRSCTTFCPSCNVSLHDRCFAAYHATNGFQMVLPFGATPAPTSTGRPRTKFTK